MLPNLQVPIEQLADVIRQIANAGAIIIGAILVGCLLAEIWAKRNFLFHPLKRRFH